MNQLKHIIFLVSLILALAINAQPSGHYEWEFPTDHGAHHEFNTEWWYFTGHLTSATKENYGFELTFFRVATSAKKLEGNEWIPGQVYLAHFALTDDSAQNFDFFDRLNRDSFQMAGAKLNTLHVWNGDWRVTLAKETIEIFAQTSSIQLQLQLDGASPIILQGENGYSKKNHEGSQSSYYYSMPKLTGVGKLQIGNKTDNITVANVWFDHEFFNSEINSQNVNPFQQSVGKGYTGWDWFALQLDDGNNLMIAQVRSNDKTKGHYYFGTWSDQSGNKKRIDQSMIELIVIDNWKSKESKINYPSKWNIKVLELGIDVTITPSVPSQELNLHHLNQLSYWEGRCFVNGSHSGLAYVELVGYEEHK